MPHRERTRRYGRPPSQAIAPPWCARRGAGARVAGQRNQFRDFDRFEFALVDIADRAKMASLFRERRPQRVIHLAAQAGVRYSVENPHAYIDSNIVGFLNVLEGCRHNDVKHLVFASTSSM